MHDDDPKKKHEDDLEREIRAGRPFDLAEAIGRAGGASLKGASPVAAARQALLGAKALLEARLPDADGSLLRTILARLENETPLLAGHADDPAAALAAWLDRVLASAADLSALVRDADARWGRDYDERPRFEGDGPPAADDPYTEAGVRTLLTDLRRGLDRPAP